MTRTAIQEARRTAEGQAVSDALTQIRAAVVGIKAKMADLVKLRAKWSAGVAAGEYDQADLDQLDQLVAPWAQFSSQVEAFLATNVGA